MRKFQKYYTYKIRRAQAVIEDCLDYVLMHLACLEVDAAWLWNILWIDEAHFHLNGTVNNQNCRIRSNENPHVIQQVPLHSS